MPTSTASPGSTSLRVTLPGIVLSTTVVFITACM